MTTEELKSIIHEKVENIDDPDFLMAIEEVLRKKAASAEAPGLSAHQIDLARQQIRRGDSLSNEQANELVDRWLNE